MEELITLALVLDSFFRQLPFSIWSPAFVHYNSNRKKRCVVSPGRRATASGTCAIKRASAVSKWERQSGFTGGGLMFPTAWTRVQSLPDYSKWTLSFYLMNYQSWLMTGSFGCVFSTIEGATTSTWLARTKSLISRARHPIHMAHSYQVTQ